MRVAIVGFMHESNTFNPLLTGRAAFEAHGLSFGPALLEEWKHAHHELAGFLEEADTQGFEPVPLLMAWATPAGPVTDDFYEEIIARLLEDLRRQPPDGLLLALHGAMVTTSNLDPDGETVARIRREFGADFPVVVSLDLHANVSARLVENCHAAVAYRTNPHIDQRECGRRAAALLGRHLRGQVRLTQALAKPATLINIMVQDTAREPLRSLMDQARAAEDKPGVLAASLLPGFPYADVPQMGPSVVVVSDGDAALAQREADNLARQVWDYRERLSRQLPGPAQAVALALRSKVRPVVLVDTGDNVGGGSAGDGTVLLAELLRQGATDSVVCLFAPQEVSLCQSAGVGAEVEMTVGGKVDRLHGDPVPVRGHVRLLHPGTYVEPEVRHGGKRQNNMGPTALLELPGGNLLVLNSLRHPPFSLGQLTCLGIDPRSCRVVVVKAAIAYKAAYLPIAGQVIEVDTPGTTAVNPARFVYRHARPLYPLGR